MKKLRIFMIFLQKKKINQKSKLLNKLKKIDKE